MTFVQRKNNDDGKTFTLQSAFCTLPLLPLSQIYAVKTIGRALSLVLRPFVHSFAPVKKSAFLGVKVGAREY
jgi:hypothetical protein